MITWHDLLSEISIHYSLLSKLLSVHPVGSTEWVDVGVIWDEATFFSLTRQEKQLREAQQCFELNANISVPACILV